MNVASLELCKELYELSGWGMEVPPAAYRFWYWIEAHGEYNLDDGDLMSEDHPPFPAYDLGYLLRKLPKLVDGAGLLMQFDGSDDDGWCIYYEEQPVKYKAFYFDAAEDAAASLAVQLFKQGILTREAKAA
ncbi:hypothetical protein [Pseudarthrobacter sp. H2]|uniref:hypothetical protein n=1 Tax=Pseudarthrobacter sp. H2 TaxID=3418415 RepID=UPI003CF77F84